MNRTNEIRSLGRSISIALVLIFICAIPAVAQDLGGNWSGQWNSCRTGHRGRLNATFCRIDEYHVQAKFRGTFARIVPFRYRAVLDIVHEEPGMMVLSGSKKLGPIMGSFSYDATVTGNQFNATYRSRRDQGYWRMSR